MDILSKPKIRVSCSRKIRIVAYSSAIFLFVLIATILATMLPVPVYTVDAERMVKTLETYHPLHCFLYENGITKMRISFGDKKYRIPIYIDLDKNTLAEKQLQNYLNTYINSLAGQNAKKYSIRIKSSSSFNDDDHFIHLDDKINHNSIGKLPQEIQANYKALEKLDTDSVIKTLGKTDYKYYRFPDKHCSDSSEDTLMELIWCYILDRNTAKELVLIFDCAINSAISEQSMYVKHAFIDINSHRLIPTKEGVQSENSSESQVSLH